MSNQLEVTNKSFFNKVKNISKKVKLIILVVLVIGAYFLYTNTVAKKTAAPQYQTATVEKGSVITTLTQSGSITSAQTNIATTTNGIIEEIYVKNGDSVKSGQSLFKVKSTATPSEQSAAYASYLSAQNSYKSALDTKKSLDSQMWSARKSYLDEQNSINYLKNNTTNPSTKQDYTELEKESIRNGFIQAQKDYDLAQQKYANADLAIAASYAQLNTATINYNATKNAVVTAITDGTVANFSSTVGGSVLTTATTPVLILGDFNNTTVKVQISEVDVSKVKQGQKVTVTIDALESKSFVGTIENVDSIGTTTSGVVSYTAVIKLISPSTDIRPGMTTSAIIQIARKDDVLKIPTQAIQAGTNGQTVRVMDKAGQIKQVNIETGISSDSETEILSGLSEGDIVVTTVASTRTTTSTTGTSPFSGLGNRGFGGTTTTTQIRGAR